MAYTLTRSAPDDLEDLDRYPKIGEALTEKLSELGKRCEVENIIVGPQVVRYEMVPADGVKMRDLPKLAPELSYEVASSVSILAPIPGKRYVGIEVPNPNRRTIHFGDVVDHARFDGLSFPVGVDVDGVVVNCSLAMAPHLLVAGQSGAGKSVFINSMLCSMLSSCTPAELALVLIDPKRVELAPYATAPHLLHPVIDNPYEADRILAALVDAMEARYDQLAAAGVRDYETFNRGALPGDKLARVVIVIDELADLMMTSHDTVEASIVRIAQKGRAAGFHLVLATQSPRVNVCTGLIKNNVPARIAFSVPTMQDSRVIIDQNGAERLLSRGDCLYLPNGGAPVRLQAPLTTIEEVDYMVDCARGAAS